MTWLVPGLNGNERRGHQFDHILFPQKLDDRFKGSQVHSQAKNADTASDHFLVTADFEIPVPSPPTVSA